MIVSGIEIDNLSINDARNLIRACEHHITNEEASMTPAELHEHLKEVPDKLYQEADSISYEVREKMRDLVKDYVVRHGDWYRDEYEDDYTDEEFGEFDPDLVHAEFAHEISHLTNELMNEFFSLEFDDRG
jgi:hypothetical protein